jgi:hypothetical protein
MHGLQCGLSFQHWLLQVTISLLQQAMDASGKINILIDGFPRNEENRAAFEKQASAEAQSCLRFAASRFSLPGSVSGWLSCSRLEALTPKEPLLGRIVFPRVLSSLGS